MSSRLEGAMLDKIEIELGDITEQKVVAIVNAANRTLLGGGGVDGAIHRAAGPALLEECRALKGCPTGEARITRGCRLPAEWVIHAVGPIWRGGDEREDELLARCYQSCFQIVLERGIRSIAFPAISTGAYGFPINRASRIAVAEARSFLAAHPHAVDRIVFVCFDRDNHASYLAAAGLGGG
jgi:O-acetyl-ADP-ribose deacetylase (regulator of RNase III)